MVRPRVDLHDILVDTLNSDNVYFQPPNNLKIQYPCIVYGLEGSTADYADNKRFSNRRRYQITLIDRNPDSLVVSSIENLEYCSFDRSFASDGLNHFVFTLHF